MASNVIIEESSNAENIICATMEANHVDVNGASVFIHAHDMQIRKSDIIYVMINLISALSKTWIVDLSHHSMLLILSVLLPFMHAIAIKRLTIC